MHGLYFQHLSFRSCGLPKIFGDWKFASNFGKVAYCRLGNARRAAVVAILPDNCHPSSYLHFPCRLKLSISREYTLAISRPLSIVVLKHIEGLYSACPKLQSVNTIERVFLFMNIPSVEISTINYFNLITYFAEICSLSVIVCTCCCYSWFSGPRVDRDRPERFKPIVSRRY